MDTRFTRLELEAILEALCARLAGEIDIADEPGSPSLEDYEAAASKTSRRLSRSRPSSSR